MTEAETLFGDEHVRRYRETDGAVGHIWREGSTILLLTTRGRKTGEKRTTPLIYAQDGDRYVIEYVDYASADGHFRKYRFIFVGQAILPYHLAIGLCWKLHHYTTDMADHEWMQREEATFLANPGAVFTPAHFETLAAIGARIGLDYFGIDCALDRDGGLVVFEVNASMLVHEDNAAFPYKDPHVRAIKAAFGELLAQRAGKAG